MFLEIDYRFYIDYISFFIVVNELILDIIPFTNVIDL